MVRTLGTSGRLRASNCLVNGVRAAAFVDTGAEVSVSNPALYAALQRHAANRQVLHGEVGLYGVTGGKVTGLDTNVDEIRLGRLELTYTELVLAALEVFDLWALSNEPALLIGMDCLRRFSRLHRLRTQGAVLRCGEGTDPTATRSQAATAPRRLKPPIQLAVETMQHLGCCIGDLGQ